MTLEALCLAERVRADFRFGEAKGTCDWADHNWRVTLRFRGRQLTADFFGGAAVWHPSAADVIYSLIMDASYAADGFSDFCENLGYDEDSRKAFGIYNACVKMAPRIRRFLGDDFDRFANAEH